MLSKGEEGSSVESSIAVLEEIPAIESQEGDIAQTSELVANDDLVGSKSSKPSEVEKENPVSVSAGSALKPKPNYDLSSPQSVDSWIDDLTEFKETSLPTEMTQMSIAEALYKLEAS